MNVMIVDDDKDFCQAMKKSLKDFSLIVCEHSYRSALNKFNSQIWDLLVVDYFLPDGDGIKLIEEMRGLSPNLKSIIVSGATTKEIAIACVNKNVSGLIEKPFSPDEFRKLLVEVVEIKQMKKSIHLNDRDLSICVLEEKIKFTTTEFKIFKFLFNQPQERFSRQVIAKYVWGDMEISENTLDTHLCNIKKKMGKHSPALTNIKGAGYAIDFSKVI